MSPSQIQRLPSNSAGKDYVVGDLHGCFDLLERLMAHVNFDKSCDRLFSVGDLIDRGPSSLNCLELLAEPWFYAVQGNHELMMLDFFASYIVSGKLENLDDHSNNGFLVYGGDWIEDHFHPDKQSMSPEFNRCLVRTLDLPLLLVVGEEDNRFHVIHAELVRPNLKSSKHFVWLDSDIDQWVEEQSIHPVIQDRLYWGRKLQSSQWANTKIQHGLSTTYCGHTYTERPQQALSHLCIDTGAFLTLGQIDKDDGYGLTLVDAQTSSWFSAAYESSEIATGVCS